MKRLLKRMPTALSALRQLGPERTFWYAIYKIGLHSGHYRRSTRKGNARYPIGRMRSPYLLPDPKALRKVMGEGLEDVITEADAITAGKIRLFGGPPVPLRLEPPDASYHWTYYESRPKTWGVEDLKLIWEPARFGWVYPLARAYRVTKNEDYPAAFWHYLEVFLAANLPNMGPNWASAQEVGLRLLALLFAASAFEQATSSSIARMERLARAIAEHAARIPLTLSYARAQNNNHRITEALALIAAGRSLPDHPQAQTWSQTGQKELDQALLSQIEPDGTYTQHSSNYHRLMLQAALQAPLFGHTYPSAVRERLAAATRWLLALVDEPSGQTPNLGSNDGAHILPLACGGFADFRPTAQAAARAFLGEHGFGPGPWDETCLWLGLPVEDTGQETPKPRTSPAVHRIGDKTSWASLRAARFHSRPSHADQLHVDLWWRGENIALDAGTYRYTAPAPWDNSLAETRVHNTVEINGRSQMRRAGRFLWLDWAQAKTLTMPEANHPHIAAQHDGYSKLGALHRRTLSAPAQGTWLIKDEIVPAQNPKPDRAFDLRLHWLLPDWPWEIEGNMLLLHHPHSGTIRLTVTCAPEEPTATLSLFRAGERLAGTAADDPILGWYSPTYNHKIPALSMIIQANTPLPYTFNSLWLLEEETDKPY